MATTESLEPKVPKERWAIRDHRVKKAPQALPGYLTLDQQVLRELLEHKVPKESPVHRALKESPAHRALKELPAHRDLRALPEHRALRVLKELLDRKGKRVLLGLQELVG